MNVPENNLGPRVLIAGILPIIRLIVINTSATTGIMANIKNRFFTLNIGFPFFNVNPLF